MKIEYFSKNGKLMPVREATVPLSSIEYAYGFGVYETIRVSNGVIYFLKDHVERLLESTKIIDLPHPFTKSFLEKSVADLAENTQVKSYNIKILLVGGPTPDEALLFAMCFSPLFPDRKLYREGAALTTYNHERIFPHAKTLDMLHSYLAFRKAKSSGAYDALLINRGGSITEGTRTNFFCIKNQVIYTPPEKDILLGVTRKALLKVALKNGYKVKERNIKINDVANYDAAFISSTSSKIVPVRSIDDKHLGPQPEALKKLMNLFDDFLKICNGKLQF